MNEKDVLSEITYDEIIKTFGEVADARSRPAISVRLGILSISLARPWPGGRNMAKWKHSARSPRDR